MIIELANSNDAQEILNLQKLAYLSEAEIYNDYTIPPLHQTLNEISDEFEEKAFLKAVIDGVIVGSVRAFVEHGTCYIGRLIVHPDYQDRGSGTKLMREIEDHFPDAKRYELFTGSGSQKNLHLYTKLGYQEYERKQLTDKVSLVFLEKHKDPDRIEDK